MGSRSWGSAEREPSDTSTLRSSLGRHSHGSRSQGPADFRFLRLEVGFSQTRCAEFLGVYRATVQAWERGVHPLPPMAHLALYLLSQSEPFVTKSGIWDGWHIGRDQVLYGPNDEYGFTPQQLQAFWIEIQRAATAQRTARQLQHALDEAVRENTELRMMFVDQGVVDELGTMQARLDELMGKLNTAKVLPFRQDEAAKRA